jgi:RND superfamily putative drug exporter
VLFGAVLALTGAVLLLSGGTTTTTANDQMVGDSAAAVRILDGTDFGDRPTETVVVTRPARSFTAEEFTALSAELTSTYRGVDGIADIGTVQLSPDGTTLILPVALNAVPADGATAEGRSPALAEGRSPAQAVAPMLDRTDDLARAHPELRIGQVGPGSVELQVNDQMAEDLRRAELVSLPVTLAILLIAFGAVVAAGIPLLLGVGAVVTALGLTAVASRHLTPVDQNTQSLVLLIGLAVGVDYALFIINRSREERAAGATVHQAVTRAAATAGRAVAISGATVVVAMSGMLVAGGMFTSLAIGTMLVVIVAVVASATVLPALLSVLGTRVDSLRLPLTRRRAARAGSTGSIWGRLAARVTRRPVAWTLGVGTLLLVMALPAADMRTSLAGVEALPRQLGVVDAHHRLTTAFPQDGTTIDVVVRAPEGEASTVDAALREAFPAAIDTGDVVGTEPEITVSIDGSVHVLALAVPYQESSQELGRAVDVVRSDVVPRIERALAGTPGVQIHVGGAAAVDDLTDWLGRRLPWVVGFVLALTFVVMLVSFGSPWLAAASVGLNLLSVGAAYGVMTLVFQHTWAEGLLGFTSIGSIAAWLPLLMFVILFGLSMDYHVFVVSRVRETWSTGVTPREAVRLGVARSAGVVTSAAAVMVGVFAIFATMSSLEMKELGVGLSTAVLLDATLVRGLLLPAVLALLGDRAHTGPRWIPTLRH